MRFHPLVARLFTIYRLGYLRRWPAVLFLNHQSSLYLDWDLLVSDLLVDGNLKPL
jgi:hypothetical protein